MSLATVVLRICRLPSAQSPLPLVLLRVVVPLVLLGSGEPLIAEQLAMRSPELLYPPEGLTWLPEVLSALQPYFGGIHRLFQASAVASALGLWTRGSLSVLAGCVVILFGGAQLSGTVIHDMHLLWLLLLLMASPCGATWSVDAWSRGRTWKRPSASLHAGVSLLVARLMLGWVYFSPGLEKLRVSGIAWALSDNLVRQMHLKWFLADGVTPWLRIDQWPALVQTGGVAVLAFELSFLFLVMTRRGRILAAAGGLVFHAMTQVFLYIPFSSLWGCYVVLWNGPRQLSASRSSPGNRAEPWPWVPTLLGAFFSLALISAGLRGVTQAWPFACYPSFAARASDTVLDLAVEVQATPGDWTSPVVLKAARSRPAWQWGATWRVMGLYGGKTNRDAIVAHAQRLAAASGQTELLSNAQLRFFAEEYSTAPDAHDAAPRRKWRLYLE